MENKEIIFLTPGETTLAKFFLWLRNTVVRILNKQWVVELPPNSGVATVRDSQNKVTIDLSKVTLGGGGGGSVVVAGTPPIQVDAATAAGVTTYTVSIVSSSYIEVDFVESGLPIIYNVVATPA